MNTKMVFAAVIGVLKLVIEFNTFPRNYVDRGRGAKIIPHYSLIPCWGYRLSMGWDTG